MSVVFSIILFSEGVPFSNFVIHMSSMGLFISQVASLILLFFVYSSYCRTAMAIQEHKRITDEKKFEKVHHENAV